jgi:hypothetical protein
VSTALAETPDVIPITRARFQIAGASPEQLAAEIQREHEACEREHEACKAAFSSTLDHGYMAGQMLIAVKGKLPHGEWQPWLTENCPALPHRTARLYMQLVRNWPQIQEAKTASVAVMGTVEAIALIAKPKPTTPEPKPLAEHLREAMQHIKAVKGETTNTSVMATMSDVAKRLDWAMVEAEAATPEPIPAQTKPERREQPSAQTESDKELEPLSAPIGNVKDAVRSLRQARLACQHRVKADCKRNVDPAASRLSTLASSMRAHESGLYRTLSELETIEAADK